MTAQQPITLYLISIASLVLGFIYTLLAILCIPYVIKVFKCLYFLPKIFYSNLFLTSCAQTCFQAIFLYQAIYLISNPSQTPVQLSDFQWIIIDMIYIPDALFWLLFLSLFWQVLVLFHHGHINTDMVSHGQRKLWDPSADINKVKMIILIYIVGQTIFIIILNTRPDDMDVVYMIMDISINASIPLLVVISEVYLNMKFSGSPFFSRNYEKKTQKLKQLTLFWAALRIPQLALNILILLFRNKIFDFMNGQSDISVFWQILFVFFMAGDFLVVTVIPFLAAMKEEFVQIFMLDFKNSKITKSFLYNNDIESGQSLYKHYNLNDHNESLQESEKIQQIRRNESFNTSLVETKFELKDLQINQEIYVQNSHIFICLKKQKSKGLGVLKRGKIMNRNDDVEYIFRVISFQKMSSYIIDELKNYMRVINELKANHIIRTLGYCVTETELILINKYYPNGSLGELFQLDENKRTELLISKNFEKKNNYLEFKLEICIQIALGLKYLHERSIVHGHLTTENILLNDDFQIKICDFGNSALKKYCGLVNGYVNKSQYTAPECFNDKKNVVNEKSATVDIYSFGLIMYELFTEKRPFENESLENIKNLVSKQQSRPKIGDNVNPDIATMIRCCWQQEQSKRPEIGSILEALVNIQEQFPQLS